MTGTGKSHKTCGCKDRKKSLKEKKWMRETEPELSAQSQTSPYSLPLHYRVSLRMEGHLQLQRALLIEGEGIKVKPNEWDALATLTETGRNRCHGDG